MSTAVPLVWCSEMAALDATARAEVARSLSSTQRLATLSALAIDARGVVDEGPVPCAELLGLFRFQRWLLTSERVAGNRGSPWWREVNGSMLLDIVEAVAAERSSDLKGPAATWHRYLHHTGQGRVRAFWTAHQSSLRAATAAAGAALADEPDREQVFIGAALGSVRLAACANLPSSGVGAHLIAAFCTTCFPSNYRDGRGPAMTRRDRALRVGAARTRSHVRCWAAQQDAISRLLGQVPAEGSCL
jgi:hypothetical protein